MARITIELLRKRAEHNEGCLSNLKEIALHQQDIEKIEVIGDFCRQLEILYLCNNYIDKIEGLRHLKWLKYLNLAVNNITRVEGLEGCEALERLDLTLNFVADLTSVHTLLANPFLEVLHLTGNPCTKSEGYRAYVVHVLPQLKELDGDDIIRAERITARQSLDIVSEAVREEVLMAREAERIKAEMLAKGLDPFPPKYNEKGERVYGHTPEERIQMLREQEAVEKAKKQQQEEPAPGSISALHKELSAKKRRLTAEEEIETFGRLLLRNEGKLPFSVEEDGCEEMVVTVEPGKFISTTLIDVQPEVNCVRVYVKGKLLQIPTEAELSPDKTRVLRSTTTGQLKITVPFAETEQEKRRQARRGGLKARLLALDAEVPKSVSDTNTGVRGRDAGLATTTAKASVDADVAGKKEDLRKALLFHEESVGVNIIPAGSERREESADAQPRPALVTEVSSSSITPKTVGGASTLLELD